MEIDTYDVVVVGGGPAGLQAALTLGRMHHRALVLDSGRYRNDPTGHLHNFLTHDGRPPAELRALARADLAAYETVTVRPAEAVSIAPEAGGFVVDLADGSHVATSRVLLATGLRDALPDVPGLAELFGSVVAHCPYCHGHEFAGTHVALIGSGPHVSRLAMLMQPIAARLTVLADGGALDEETAALLDREGVAIRPDPVVGVCRSAAGARVSFASGPDEEVGGIFVTTALTQSAPFAEQLGLDLLPSGCVEVDAFGRTSLSGVYAAGDLAHTSAVPMPIASVLNAAAAGLVAATAVDADRVLALVGAVPAAG
ncbi:NAD(P)/FAD-dependent oxidoreductase [Nocardioides sp. cx-169]|uniref:NAD(P)/FAD-dependent oxidoreductase n=1 Tax=Nocardioides sp. cx-169 TaxID=2899080 RepID=UPI001E659B6C|nr:NAD(P)/FAD-dependent oxidoreductase [Nocardioides sp. cx-169]MCD4533202.1 NAD(P)/FAD-dependent oxidoreductase [Nocardioides sp. cx-169]